MYINGYTTNSTVVELKSKIKNMLISAKRLDKLALAYEDKLIKDEDGKVIRSPVEYKHLKSTSDLLYKEIYNLGTKIQKERKMVSDINPYRNKRLKATNDKVILAVIKDFLIEIGQEQLPVTLLHGVHLIHYGFHTIEVRQVKDIHSCTAHNYESALAKNNIGFLNSTIDKMNWLGQSGLANFIESYKDAIELDVETNKLFMVFTLVNCDKTFELIFNY